METAQITLKLVRANNIDQFRNDNGTRKIYLHYYQMTNNGKWLLRWIEKDTDAKRLQELIKEGKIYLIE
jgi:hypothetical protein